MRIPTIDGVTLHGTFYSVSRRYPPTVLLLHALGEDSSQKGWTVLAKELQAKGYAVLAFDFRGHGKSTQVDPTLFWAANTLNTASYIRGQPGRGDIEFKDFNPAYYATLINDIAAARAYLDRKNDAGGCNSSSLVVIGAEEGATLGAAWLNSESYRYKTRRAPFPTMPPIPEKRAEGESVICAIWLSLSPKLGNRTVNMPSTLALPGKVRRTPMLFLHSSGDEGGGRFARYLEKNLVVYNGREKDPAYKFTAAVDIDAGQLRGSDLLQQATAERLSKYLEAVLLEKGNEWQNKDFRNSQYHWIFNPRIYNVQNWQPAKPIGDQNMMYNTYTRFLAQ